MKITLVGFSFGRTGGIESVSRDTAAFLAADGHDVNCIGVHDPSGTAVHGIGSATHVGLSPARGLARAAWYRSPLFVQRFRLMSRLPDSDVLILCHPFLLRLVHRCMGSTRAHVPTLCWLHGREVWGKCGLNVRDSLPLATRLIAVSDYTARTVTDLIGRTANLSVIHNPVDTNLFTPSVTRQIRRFSILTTGRQDSDTSHKGYDTLIRCLYKLSQTHAAIPLTLDVTGDGPRLRILRELATELGVQNKVTFHRDVDRSKLLDLYRSCDVFALPSSVIEVDGGIYGEGFGVVNIEAASCGRPVITSTHGGCPETIVDGETGMLVDPGSDDSVAAAISKMFSLTAAERDAMGARGRAMVIERFSRDRFREKLGDLIQSVT